MILSGKNKGLWLLAQDFALLLPLKASPVTHIHPTNTFPVPLVATQALETHAMEKPSTHCSKQHKLKALKEKIQVLDCDLKHTATQMVFADGHVDAPIMAIGEAPGADEDRQGKPFVGVSGQLLDRCFKAVGLTRQQHIYITNVIPWRPPGNRTPTPFEVKQCLPFLYEHIGIIQPQMILLVGATASRAFMGVTTKTTWVRGQWRKLTLPHLAEPVTAMPIYHPAYLLRSPRQKEKMWYDLLAIKEKAQPLFQEKS